MRVLSSYLECLAPQPQCRPTFGRSRAFGGAARALPKYKLKNALRRYAPKLRGTPTRLVSALAQKKPTRQDRLPGAPPLADDLRRNAPELGDYVKAQKLLRAARP